MLNTAEKILANINRSEKELRAVMEIPALFLRNKVAYLPWQDGMLAVADYRQLMPSLLEGEPLILSNGGYGLVCPWNSRNIAALQTILHCLQPRLPVKPMSWLKTEPGRCPVFKIESASGLEKTVVDLFCQGWDGGFAVTSKTLSNDHTVPYLTADESVCLPDGRQTADYANHTFILKNTTIRFSAEKLAYCTRRYTKVLNYITNLQSTAHRLRILLKQHR